MKREGYDPDLGEMSAEEKFKRIMLITAFAVFLGLVFWGVYVFQGEETRVAVEERGNCLDYASEHLVEAEVTGDPFHVEIAEAYMEMHRLQGRCQ